MDEHNENFITSWPVTLLFLQLVRYRVKVSGTMTARSSVAEERNNTWEEGREEERR